MAQDDIEVSPEKDAQLMAIFMDTMKDVLAQYMEIREEILLPRNNNDGSWSYQYRGSFETAFFEEAKDCTEEEAIDKIVMQKIESRIAEKGKGGLQGGDG